MTAHIVTYSGKYLDLMGFEPAEIRIEDIAHALACVNRFAGHARQPISVAQHSVYVSRLCNGSALQGLLHDASEAYLGDITKWLKGTPMFDGYRELEATVQRRIFERFGCAPELAPEVEAADRLMVRFEIDVAFDGEVEVSHPAYPRISESERLAIDPWQPWSWETSKREFLLRFEEVRR